MKRRIAFLALASALAAAPAFGQSKTGTTLGQFLLIEPSARISAMGNAGVSLADGLEAFYYNPAALAAIERFDLIFSHSSWVADIRYNYVALGVPLGRFGSAVATVTSLGSGDMEVRTVEAPLGTGELFSVSDIALGVGYGIRVTPRFAVGGQIHWLQETIWNSRASTSTLSIGTIYRVSERGLHIGSSLCYFGTQGEYDGRDLRILYDADPASTGDNPALPAEQFTDPFDLPVLFRVGVGYPWHVNRDTRLHFTLDAFHPSDESESVSAGAELTLRRAYAVRVGWQNAFQQDAETGLTAGFGLRGDLEGYGYRIDYGWADFGRLGSVQRLGLGLTFGGGE
jgi:hypothetical protein